MATKKQTENLPMNWQAELAAQANEAAAMEASVSTGEFFSLKNGNLSWGGNPSPNNEMAVIILDGILENVYFEGQYDPDTPQQPKCYAYGRNDDDMSPHENVVKDGLAECSESCADCPNNVFGSALTGKGKACRNTRRLALLPAGNFSKSGEFEPFDEDAIANGDFGYMKLPVTSVKGYATFVKQVAATMKRPPHGVITRVFTTDDKKSQFKVGFEVIDEVPNELMATVMERHKEAREAIMFPYPKYEEPQEQPKRKAPARAKGGRKY